MTVSLLRTIAIGAPPSAYGVPVRLPLPRWPLANTYTGVMAGDSVDPLIAGAYAFGARDFDTVTALAAMVKGATVTPRTLAQGF